MTSSLVVDQFRKKKLRARRSFGLQAAVGRANGSKGADFGLEAKATRTSEVMSA